MRKQVALATDEPRNGTKGGVRRSRSNGTVPTGSHVRQAFDMLPCPAAIRSASGKYEVINQAFAAAFGLSPDAAEATNDTLLPAPVASAVKRAADQASADGRPASLSCELRDATAARTYAVTCVPLPAPPHTEALSLVTVSEPARRVDESPRPTDDLMCGILASHADGLLIVTDSRVELANRTMCEWLGRTPDQVVGHNPAEFIVPSELPRSLQRLAAMPDGEGLGAAEYTLVSQDGSHVPVEVSTTRFASGGREVIVSVLRDLRDRHAAMDAQQAHLRHLERLDRISEAFGRSLDADQMIENVLQEILTAFDCDRAGLVYPLDAAATELDTPAMASVPGFEPPRPGEIKVAMDDEMREHFSDLLVSDGPLCATDLDPWWRPPAIARQLGVRAYMGTVMRPRIGAPWLLLLNRCTEPRPWSREEQRLFQDVAHRLSDIMSHVLLYRHLTESQRDLEQAVAELQRSNTELERFALIVSHDLKEPLRTIANCVQVLQMKLSASDDPAVLRLAADAVAGAFRMSLLIDDLLSYSRAGVSDRPFEPTDMNRVLERALSDLRPMIEESGALVTHEALPTVVGDPVQLAQVLRNLIGNAVKFRGPLPLRVHLSATSRNGTWVISVRDNGMGFEELYKEQIFEIFQRLHASQERPGTGIGLAICKKIVERHGGRIWAESSPGSGSTFHLSIPGHGADSVGGRT